MIIKLKDRLYHFSFGLNSLIILNDLLKDNREIDFDLIVYLGLIKAQPQITINEAKLVAQGLDELSKNQIKNLYNKIDSLTELEAAELYAKAIGEIGIQPSQFWQMSKEEIEWAYQGYLKKKESEANLVATAIKFVNNKNPNLIRLTEDKGYTVGSFKERNNTFKALGIEVDDDGYFGND